MLSDKEVKKQFKIIASKDPDRYYATSVLKSEGFMRKQCKCGTFFWTVDPDRQVCGDPSCSGGFKFIGKTPAKKEMDYIGVWNEFSKLFSKWGYTPIKRYPVVARWRDDTDFVQASIYDFQPYVVSGEVEPPANPLVVPQFSLRFNDIDNVGITGAHYTGFVMIGQHAFMPPNLWNQAKYFTDIYNWLRQGIGLPKEEITFHEDAWAGGGNFGPCMEYFSRGLELGNQVYMMFEQTPSGNKELKLKVLDMGMGHERNAWFTKGASTSYETTFPTVIKKMQSLTGVKADDELMKKFLPYSSYLNVDEVENIDAVWKDIAKKIDVDTDELKSKILPLAALYSIAEHSRALLVALSDGALPSNAGGGYNLRVILRRALAFIDKYKWNVELPAIAEWHAEYLKPLFPELSEHLDEVNKILEVEKNKYETTKQKTREIVIKIAKEDISEDKLIELYDSQGIAPEIIAEEAKKLGKKAIIPDDFYARVAAMHETAVPEIATEKTEMIDFGELKDTEVLYYDDYLRTDFNANVLKISDNFVLLDSTAFYPTSGGQLHDIGKINGEEVIDVFKQGSLIVHKLKDKPVFEEGDKVKCEIDAKRREQLAQHHTATHIINAAARRILGNHINQCGAKKTIEKASLDITHYQSLNDDELKAIEEEANEIVSKNYKVNSLLLLRNDAEKRFGMSIYQGGAVPGKIIRIIEIPDADVEACGGTHLKHTEKVGKIKILKSSKIQDGVVRIEFAAGNAAEKEAHSEKSMIEKAAMLLDCKPYEVPGRADELFKFWKEIVKKEKDIGFKLSSKERFDGDILSKTSEILKTQPEYIVKTIERFLSEISDIKEKKKS